jgi:hypothetical protein
MRQIVQQPVPAANAIWKSVVGHQFEFRPLIVTIKRLKPTHNLETGANLDGEFESCAYV